MRMQEKRSDVFETADLGMAAFLLVNNCPLLAAGKEKNRFSFVFEGEQRCATLAIEYVNSDFSRNI
jgi:hypothetical protein